VAWAAERKNVLSLLFYLLALLSYLRRTRGGGWRWYVLALALFVLALLSKTAVVTFPATALLCDRLILRRWTPRSFAHIVPFVLLGVLAAVLTHVVEQRNAGANIARLDPVWRPFAAAGALWFYVGKLLVPVNLAGVYERWDIGAHWPVFALALLAVPTAMYVIWRGRRRLPPQVPWGLAHYILALGPMLGLVSFNYTQFSFVADHFAYLPAIGLFVALAALADAARLRLTTSAPLHAPTDACSTPPRVPFTRQLVATLPTLAVLAVLGTLTWRQTATLWHDARSFWEETCRMSPNGWVGHYQLANLDAREQRWPQAAEHYRRAAEVKPDLHQACGFLGDALWKLGDRAGALAAYERGIAVVPYASTKWIDYRHTPADILAVLAREQGRPEHLQTAEKYLREAAGKPLFRAQIKLARYLRSQQRYAEAANFYQAALKVQQATPQEIATARQELAALPPQSGENVP